MKANNLEWLHTQDFRRRILNLCDINLEKSAVDAREVLPMVWCGASLPLTSVVSVIPIVTKRM